MEDHEKDEIARQGVNWETNMLVSSLRKASEFEIIL